MKKLIFLLLFILTLSSVSAYFPEAHTYIMMKAFREIDSPITRACVGKESQILGGHLGTDASVVHYLDNDVVNYIGLHNKQAYNRCIEIAGGDLELKCMCYGIAMHVIQDEVAHKRVVPSNIERYWGQNVIIHALTEFKFDLLTHELSETDPIVPAAELEKLAQSSFDVFTENNFDNKYVKLFNQITNFNMEDEIRLVGGAISTGSWYSNVWNPEKISLPVIYYMMGFVIMAIGLAYALINFFLGINRFKFVGVTIGVTLFLIGFVVTLSMFLGTSWLWFKGLATFFDGFVTVPTFNEEIQVSIEASKRFFENEILLPTDASGLTRYINGIKVVGELEQAEWRFKFIVQPILIIVTLITMISTFMGAGVFKSLKKVFR